MNIINKKQSSKKFSALTRPEQYLTDELKTLVKKYQQGDAHAAELLRRRFFPLIYKLSHRQTVYNVLGEDAESIAWLLFFEFIYYYHGNDFVRLPGLVKRFLIFRIMRQLEHRGLGWDVQAKVEEAAQLESAVEDETLPQVLLAIALQQELSRLPKRQQEILRAIYYGDVLQPQIASKFHCSTRSVRLYKTMGLQTLRQYLKTS